MNCEAYIVRSGRHGTRLFPANVEENRIHDICACACEDDTLLIRRHKEMVYYMYLRKLSDSQDTFAGIGVALNSLVIDDVERLHKFFRQEMRKIADGYGLATYDNSTGTYHESDKEAREEEARDRLMTTFNSRFQRTGQTPGALDYSARGERDSLKVCPDGETIRFSAALPPLREYPVRRSIEAGNTLIVTNEISDEKEIARLRREIKQLKLQINQNRVELNRLKNENEKLKDKAKENKANPNPVLPGTGKTFPTPTGGDDSSQLSKKAQRILLAILILAAVALIAAAASALQ